LFPNLEIASAIGIPEVKIHFYFCFWNDLFWKLAIGHLEVYFLVSGIAPSESKNEGVLQKGKTDIAIFNEGKCGKIKRVWRFRKKLWRCRKKRSYFMFILWN